jgi:hypothetical protein
MPYKPNPEARGVSRKTDREGSAAMRVAHKGSHAGQHNELLELR